MQSLHVNGYDMPYLDVGEDGGRAPLVCVHGSLNDFRVWGCVLGPLTQRHRVIAVSLRHFFPDRWDGVGETYSIAQHVQDVIAFIEKLDLGPVDLMGHSRGGHICFRVAQQRPDLLRRLILAEPGGELDASLDPDYVGGPSPLLARFTASAEKIAAGDVDGGLAVFVDTLEGAGTWPRLPAMVKQNLRDNAYTLIGQVRDNRPPFSKADAESIKMPTLFILGARTKGLLPKVLHALAAHAPYSKTAIIPNATHPMFEQAPQKYSEVVLDFLAS
ncbi:alpha/beta fold hydrolase [Bradyrhizobium arachidis]|uniref:Alpha/beta hydrolase n=1 Tax=Bradyrhizobium arachidis TaxID=858423 RepID=A0AAE7TLJ3_9BRAD|nr:alpha/beta hydrolase [Bradyrhizobium arachidis]QOZ72459.1 alpha/beta hydrolase [Bradyrhizobium arachidis]SFU91727.1 Pimeloyl-ACP methyl ester carboxylesterase [Bradyrhizobium arachidis]